MSGSCGQQMQHTLTPPFSLSLCSRKQDEVVTLEMQIRQRSEQQKKAGVELDATCHICLKTKFADGVGHICHYCNIRCCARCGGKVTLRSNKVSAPLLFLLLLCLAAMCVPPDSLTHFTVGNFRVPLDEPVTGAATHEAGKTPATPQSRLPVEAASRGCLIFQQFTSLPV